jgi:hypothetical protein
MFSVPRIDWKFVCWLLAFIKLFGFPLSYQVDFFQKSISELLFLLVCEHLPNISLQLNAKWSVKLVSPGFLWRLDNSFLQIGFVCIVYKFKFELTLNPFFLKLRLRRFAGRDQNFAGLSFSR